MSKVVRRSQRGPQRGEGSRRVFRRRRRIPTGLVVRQLLAVLLMLSGGIGVVVMLQRLPEQVDVVLLVSEAIADLIRVRVDLGSIVVAVTVDIDVAVRRATGLEERLGIAVAILVRVRVVPCGVSRTGINFAVAVVVDIVTDLGRVG